MAKMKTYWHGFAMVDPGGGRGFDNAVSDRIYADPALVDSDPLRLTAGGTVRTGGFVYTIDGIFYTLAATSCVGDCRGFSTNMRTGPNNLQTTRYVAVGLLVNAAGAVTPIWTRSTAALTAADLPDIPDTQLLIGYFTLALTAANGFSSLAPYSWGYAFATHGGVFYDGTPVATMFEKKI